MRLIKPYQSATSTLSGTTTTQTAVTPIVSRYFASVVIGNILGGVTTVPATSFKNDQGVNLPPGGLPVPGADTFYNVFVNGILQQGGLVTLTANNLTIRTALTIGVSVNIEVVNITASSTTNTTGLSVNTTIQS
ncbi:DUF4183 domain-containing protein [Heyndrickxia vini]|uniref:DUF4183 domain-containing protein n=1 Tax=Heyndrickxia vini TaxID=1476025 RepID=A0ABX7E7Y9_9BACI|nr:DUF4183 domain-containing protein [Heyndrickxia vini]